MKQIQENNDAKTLLDAMKLKIQDKENELTNLKKEYDSNLAGIKTQKAELLVKEKTLEEHSKQLDVKEKQLVEKEKSVASTESKLSLKQSELDSKEQQLREKEQQLVQKEKELNDAAAAAAAAAEAAPPPSGQSTTESSHDEEGKEPLSSKETEEPKQDEKVGDESPSQPTTIFEEETNLQKCKRMIKEELDSLIKETIETELEEPSPEDEEDEEYEIFEQVAIDALHTAANNLAYKKMYYDVMNDNIIFFPSVTKLIVNFELIEEAEKYYYDEEDEFPMMYSAALRSVATMRLINDGGHNNDQDHDEEYMEKLAIDVE